ncbi:uncharacterized protein JCM15063_001017 [Sporobolomyces koalae]|uniref:uncharacterized protein n=1 Tax=Sporobolomyces koalae TaxID=500713 RepID=UPI003179FEC9
MDVPFSAPSAGTVSGQLDSPRAILIVAFALPLFLIVSGSIVAFLCWQRLRKRQDRTHGTKQLPNSLGSSTPSDEPVQRASQIPMMSAFSSTRPLLLPLRLSTTPPTPNHTVRKPQPISSSFSLASVATTMTPTGTRVLAKKNRRTWPPPISFPLELVTLDHQPATAVVGSTREDIADDRDSDGMDRGAPATDLSRGVSLVSGYHSQSNHPHQLHEVLAREARDSRNSWNTGDEDSVHFTSDQSPRRRARSLSLSSYSHETIGATTLGKLIDQEVTRIAHMADAEGDPIPTRDAKLVSEEVAPLELLHRPVTPHPWHSIPFPRLPALSHPSRFRSNGPVLTSRPLPLPYDAPNDRIAHGQNDLETGRAPYSHAKWASAESLLLWGMKRREERKRERDQALHAVE